MAINARFSDIAAIPRRLALTARSLVAARLSSISARRLFPRRAMAVGSANRKAAYIATYYTGKKNTYYYLYIASAMMAAIVTRVYRIRRRHIRHARHLQQPFLKPHALVMRTLIRQSHAASFA